MEPCPTYEPWHDKRTGNTFIRSDRGKCLHYHFYFIDEMLGLSFLTVPTWCPRSVSLNGHKGWPRSSAAPWCKLRLSSSEAEALDLVGAQNDAMAIGARKFDRGAAAANRCTFRSGASTGSSMAGNDS